MKHVKSIGVSCMTAGCLMSFGCQSIQRVTYRPAPPATRSMVLAVDFGPQQAQPPATPPSKADDEKNKKDGAVTKSPAGSPGVSPATDAKGQPKQGRLPYTPPPVAMMLMVGMRGAQSQNDANVAGGGREAAEGSIGATGRAGLAPLQQPVGPPGAGGQLPPAIPNIGRPGLQRGAATALGLSSQFNVLTPQINPLAGSMGRCQELVNVGFFGGSLPGCEANFRR